MLRGWSGSSFSHAVNRDVINEITRRLAARGIKPQQRGFMLDAVHRLDNKRRLTVKGSGQIVLTPHNKNSRRVKPEKVTGLKTVIEGHAAQLNLPFPHRLSNTLLKFTSGVKINGRPWKKGVHCLYYLPTDRRVDDFPLIGKILFLIWRPSVSAIITSSSWSRDSSSTGRRASTFSTLNGLSSKSSSIGSISPIWLGPSRSSMRVV